MVTKIKHERTIASIQRFFIYKGKLYEKYPYSVCDAERPNGKKVRGRFKTEKEATGFLEWIRAEYVRFGNEFIVDDEEN